MTDVLERAPVTDGGTLLRYTIAADYLASGFARFSLVPVLAIMLTRSSGGASWVTGVGLFGFLVCAGLGMLPFTRVLSRLPYACTLPGGMFCSAACAGSFAYVHGTWLPLLLLFGLGFGISVHTTLCRVLVIQCVGSEQSRNNIYGLQQVMTNIAGAVGPFIAGALYLSGDGRPLLGFVAGAYVLAGAALLIGLPKKLVPPSGAAGPAGRGWLAGSLQVLREPGGLRACVATTCGSFAYGQFYSAFALLVALGIGPVLLRGALLAGPPMVIAALQVVVTIAVNRRLRAGATPVGVMVAGMALFAVSIALLGVGLPIVIGSIVAMTVWSFAEMVFVPVVSLSFNRITSVSRVAASNLQGLAWTAGEGLGSLCGGAIFLVCYRGGLASAYWLALAAVTFAGVLACVQRRPAAAGVAAPASSAPASSSPAGGPSSQPEVSPSPREGEQAHDRA
ncbi:MAG TPA: MFS transporter [Trebonia sp.]|jgi:MFS family permease|nr:MFS transporter [Trebonia sp.]